jgi:hypothetical protein
MPLAGGAGVEPTLSEFKARGLAISLPTIVLNDLACGEPGEGIGPSTPAVPRRDSTTELPRRGKGHSVARPEDGARPKEAPLCLILSSCLLCCGEQLG